MIAAGVPSLAAAQSNCQSVPIVLQMIESKFGETAVGHGLTSDGQSLHSFYRNEKTGTWSMIVRYTNGVACILASGKESFLEPRHPGDPT